MAGAIAITRREMTAAELRAASGKAKSARAARRMLAIALVLEGVDRKTAAETCGMDRQSLRDWVHRTNAEGLAGLENRRRRARRGCSLQSRRRCWRRGWKRVPTRSSTGWCGGGAST